MTKAQMAERIAELEREVEALKAGASVATHVHYHYPPQTFTPIDYTKWSPYFTYEITTSGDAIGGV